jgi:excisionase family DNA binding protein
MDRDHLVTIEEAAAYLACTPAAIKKWIRLKTLASVKVGRLRRIRKSALEALIREGSSHAVRQAQTALRAVGRDANRLEGYTWHSNRHSFASRLVMAGVDLRTVQELGGWKTLGMVLRYSHLAPSHLQAAVERLVPTTAVELARRDGSPTERPNTVS